MEVAVFAIFALVSVVSALVVISHRDPVKSTLALVVVLFSLAVLFVLLGAAFIAAVQVLLYAGAIIVLFLFVVMLLNIQREARSPADRGVQRWIALLSATFFAGLLAMLFWRSTRQVAAPPLGEELVSLHGLARKLFTDYLLPFEMVGLLLLAAVVAATLLARRPPATPHEESDA